MKASELTPSINVQVRKVAEENGVDVSQQIQELETRARQVLLGSAWQMGWPG